MYNKLLSYKNIPNTLSLLRALLAVPFIVSIHDIFVYACTKNLGLLLLFFAIILSDIADGFLARKLNCASNTGAKLDIISDTVYTMLSLTAFAYFKIIPVWFIFILILKLIEFYFFLPILFYTKSWLLQIDVMHDVDSDSSDNDVIIVPSDDSLPPSGTSAVCSMSPVAGSSRVCNMLNTTVS